MGLFDFLKKKEQPETVAQTEKPVQKQTEPYLGDLNKTDIIYRLAQTPQAERDEKWQQEFLDNIGNLVMDKYIPKEILEAFTNSFEKAEVWQIHTGERWLTVFLYSDSQIKDNEGLPIFQKMKEEYYKLVDQYLDLQITSANDISLNFDSKENFEKKYQGNWYAYYH